jgi:hypothetical protein
MPLGSPRHTDEKEAGQGTVGKENRDLVPLGGAGQHELVSGVGELPDIIRRAGDAAVFAAEEFFDATIQNDHTRRAYMHAVKQFLAWAEARGLQACATRTKIRLFSLPPSAKPSSSPPVAFTSTMSVA